MRYVDVYVQFKVGRRLSQASLASLGCLKTCAGNCCRSYARQSVGHPSGDGSYFRHLFPARC